MKVGPKNHTPPVQLPRTEHSAEMLTGLAGRQVIEDLANPKAAAQSLKGRVSLKPAKGSTKAAKAFPRTISLNKPYLTRGAPPKNRLG